MGIGEIGDLLSCQRDGDFCIGYNAEISSAARKQSWGARHTAIFGIALCRIKSDTIAPPGIGGDSFAQSEVFLFYFCIFVVGFGLLPLLLFCRRCKFEG